MSDHDFEKQVHQKLEELKLRPSDTVWMEVEKNIRQEKRRRRFLWLWTAALFITLTTSGVVLYYYTSGPDKTIEMAEATPATLSNETATVSPNSTNKQATTVQPVPENASSNRNDEPVQSIQPTENDQPVAAPAAAQETTPVSALPNKKQPTIVVTEKNREEKTEGNINKRPAQKLPAHFTNDNEPVPAINGANAFREKPRYRKKKNLQSAIVMKENLDQQEAAVAALEEVQRDQDAIRVSVPVVLNDDDVTIATDKAVTAPFSSKSVHLMMPDSLSIATAATLPIQRKRPVLWHWGIVTNAGFSRIAESKLLQLRGLLGQEKTTNDDRAYSSPTAGNNSLINVSASTTAKNASPIQSDLSFSAGVFVQRALSPRLKLSLGLEYTYMSVNTQVGQKVNSPMVINTDTLSAKIVPEYYKSPGYAPASADATLTQNAAATYQVYYNNKYRYRFQYIEIPLLINWQINKGRRLPPVVFEGGVSISQLLSVDALHFKDIKGGIYYEDKDLFNKTQFNFVTGLNVGLLQKSNHPIWIGPTLRYALNGLVKKDVSTGQYMWSTGITVKMLLGRL
jgi:hypothetical protein